MPSSGAGADISAQDAMDLLHKLVTESTKVQAVFHGRGSVRACLVSSVRIGSDGLAWVRSGDKADESFLTFDPGQARSFKFADNRIFSAATTPVGSRFASALLFIYSDDSQVALFEIAADDE